jgi:multidrug efflux system membrane fusion protein
MFEVKAEGSYLRTGTAAWFEREMIRRKLGSAGSLLVVMALVALAGCGQNTPAVTVALPIQRTITDVDEYVGRFVAVDDVEIRSRVSGYLDKIYFKDGQMVKEGDLLFTIDKRPFQTALDQARANLKRAQAELAFAQGDLDRAAQLVRDKTITQQTFDQRTQVKNVAEANVAAAEAAVRQAQLDLEFTDLRAPVSGRIGDRRVSVGNLVTGGTTGNTTLLATIVTTDPIRFEFTFDEASYLRYERLANNGNVGKARDNIAARGGASPVKLKLIDEKNFTHTGQMDFVDNVIDKSTGTIRGRAAFANPQDLFTPGMFARVQIAASAPYTALLVPDSAIGSEQARKFVYIVKPDDTVAQKYVELGPLDGNDRVIKSGLEATDRVVVDGLMRVRPGVKVKPEMRQPPASAAATGTTGTVQK